jgi:RNA polymerase sigma-70 factor (ECF subfamily)
MQLSRRIWSAVERYRLSNHAAALCIQSFALKNQGLALSICNKRVAEVRSMPPPHDDRSLWLARCILPHEAGLRRWLHGISVLDEADVDDLVQETYAVLVTLPSVAKITDPRAYAFQVARSLLLQGLRRARIVSINAVADLAVLEVPDDAPSPFEQVAGRDDLHLLQAAIDAMPPQTRRAFTLRRIEGFSQREVAQITALSESTVEKHMSRAIRILMAQFGRGGKPNRRASPSREPSPDAPAQADTIQESQTPDAATRDSQYYR